MVYADLAAVYDQLMQQDVQYDTLCDLIEKCFRRYGRNPELIVDLACGTGSVTSRMAQRGYDMIGIDISEEMLNIARKKDEKSLYLEQDITAFELYGTVDAALCMIDGYNYVIDDEKLLNSFLWVKNYLNPEGLFLFDVSSDYKLSTLLGNETFVYEDDNVFYTWENEFDEQTDLSSSYITFFVKEGDMYRRFDEVHIQKARSISHIIHLLEKAGFSDIHTFADSSFAYPQKDSQRVFFSSIIHKE